jgi:hypothetical protein
MGQSEYALRTGEHGIWVKVNLLCQFLHLPKKKNMHARQGVS